jgi:hypothetical protein
MANGLHCINKFLHDTSQKIKATTWMHLLVQNYCTVLKITSPLFCERGDNAQNINIRAEARRCLKQYKELRSVSSEMQTLFIHTAEMPQHKSPITYVITQGLQQWQDMLARVSKPHNSQDKIWRLTITIFYSLRYTNKNRTAAVSARKQFKAQNLQTWYDISGKRS